MVLVSTESILTSFYYCSALSANMIVPLCSFESAVRVRDRLHGQTAFCCVLGYFRLRFLFENHQKKRGEKGERGYCPNLIFMIVVSMP